MPFARKHIGRRAVNPEHLGHSLLAHKYCFEMFMADPMAMESTSIAFPGGTDTNRILLHTGFNRFSYTYIGGASDAFVPVLGSEGGYDWHLDHDTAAEGCVINFGGHKPGHPRTYKVSNAGEDVFARVLLNCADASGLNALFGFQDAGTIPAGFTDYTNFFGIRILGDSSSTTAQVRAESNLGNTGSTDPVTYDLGLTLEEPTEMELEVRVKGMTAYWYVNGVEKKTTLVKTLTGTPTLTPTLTLLQTTDTTATVTTRAFECGRIKDRSAKSLRTLLTELGVPAGT